MFWARNRSYEEIHYVWIRLTHKFALQNTSYCCWQVDEKLCDVTMTLRWVRWNFFRPAIACCLGESSNTSCIDIQFILSNMSWLSTLRSFNIAIETGDLQWIYPLKIVIFHSYVSIPEGMVRVHKLRVGELNQLIFSSKLHRWLVSPVQLVFL